MRLFFALTALLAMSIFVCVPISAAGGEKRVKIGFVYVSPVDSAGWSFTHDQARRELAKDPNVSTYSVENVPEGPDSENILRAMSLSGYDIIVTTSFGYMDFTLKIAGEFPGITYLHCSGYKTAPNMSCFFGRMYQARYLSGMVAGSMTKSNVIGFVAAYPIPEVIRGINAFTLGAREVNPKVEVRVIWTKSWYDPFVEKKAAEDLVTGGADIIAQHADPPAAQEAAEALHAYSIGYSSDMSAAAPNAHLVAPVWNWYPFYEDVVDKVRNGTWHSGTFWPGMESGIVDLSPFGPMVPQEVRDRVAARKADIIAGRYRVFQGPVRDRDGALRIAEGETPSDQQLLEMNWFVQGVAGALGAVSQ